MNFTIVKHLGKGTYGAADLVQDTETKQLYVRKRGYDLLPERKALEEILPECNPYLSCFVEAEEDEEGDVTTIITEYIPGTYELGSYIFLNHRNLNFYSKFVIMTRLLEGLAVLHGLNVVHRDIKPENILIDPKNFWVRYIDFGFSCAKRDSDCLHSRVGTPVYISPELARAMLSKKSLSWKDWRKTDIWALGITFINLCFPGLMKYFYDYSSQKALFEDIASVHPMRRLIEKGFPDKDRPPSQKQLFYIKIISLMLDRNVERRPSAKSMLDLVRTRMTDELLEVAKTTDFLEIERVALERAETVEVDPKTSIFPSKSMTDEKDLGMIQLARKTI